MLKPNLMLKADQHMREVCKENPDPSHDMLHVRRVVHLANKLCKAEKGNLEVVGLAAYLHDCVYISKTDSRRSQASSLSAKKAVELLKSWGVEEEPFLVKVGHAVAAHSFSANIKATSLEAKIVQDADRLDAMGAIGVARTLAFSGLSKRALYNEEDPFCENREPNDSTNTLDHFFTKLLHLQDRLNTESAKAEGLERLALMKIYLTGLKRELLI